MEDLLVVGNLARDKIGNEDYFGGSAGTIAINAAKLGISASILSVIGKDSYSLKYLNYLRSAGVDVSRISEKLQNLPICKIKNSLNSNLSRVWVDNGAFFEMSEVTVDVSWIKRFRLIHLVSCPPALVKKIATIGLSNSTLSFDPGPRVLYSSDYVDANIVNKAKLLFANEEEMSSILNILSFSSPKDLLYLGPEAVVVTRGNKGSIIYYRGKESDKKRIRQVMIKAYTVQSIDPTGAGDAYRVGFFYGLLRRYQWKQCGQLGSFLASRVVTQPGGILADGALNKIRNRLK